MSEQFSIRYRPTKLSDMVVGNRDELDKAAAMLKKAQAILISGHSGAGKTTLGLILSSMMNGGDAKKCLIEKNCAEESGKDLVREVQEFIAFKPQGNKHVVLLDEVQGLTSQAMAALLKVIESPPHAKVLFILCTNEPFKLKETLINRCRKIHIEQPSYKDLAAYMFKIIKPMKLRMKEELQKKMCIHVAKASNCVPREAMQMLEDCVDLIEAGKKWESIKTSISKAEDGNIDKIVGSTLIALYSAMKDKEAGKEAAMFILEQMPSDAMGYLTRLQTANYYGMQQMMGGKWAWQGKVMVEALKAKKINPPIDHMLRVSSGLNDIRERLRDMVTDPAVLIGTGIAKMCVGIK